MSKGIKDSLELLSFLKSLASTLDESLKDGKIDMFDVLGSIKLEPSLAIAIDGIDEIQAELKDLNDQERQHLIQEFKDVVTLFVRALKTAQKKS